MRNNEQEISQGVAEAIGLAHGLAKSLLEPIFGPLPSTLNDNRAPFGPKATENAVRQCRKDGGVLVTGIGIIKGEDRFRLIKEFNNITGRTD